MEVSETLWSAGIGVRVQRYTVGRPPLFALVSSLRVTGRRVLSLVAAIDREQKRGTSPGEPACG